MATVLAMASYFPDSELGPHLIHPTVQRFGAQRPLDHCRDQRLAPARVVPGGHRGRADPRRGSRVGLENVFVLHSN